MKGVNKRRRVGLVGLIEGVHQQAVDDLRLLKSQGVRFEGRKVVGLGRRQTKFITPSEVQTIIPDLTGPAVEFMERMTSIDPDAALSRLGVK